MAAVLFSVCSFGHDPISTKLTWTRDVSRIIYGHCSSCHRENGSSMPLVTYADARPWAKAIKEEVLQRRMPPWGAVKGFGHFQGDVSLSQEEIDTIAEWVEGGAPEGDPQWLPAAVPAGVMAPAVTRPCATMPVAVGQVLRRRVTVIGIRPLSGPDSARVVARRPDGSAAPLLWLYGYTAHSPREFYYREPLHLPAGTRIEGTKSLRFELLTRASRQAR